MTFGKWVREMREINGWTLQRLADEAGTCKSYIWDIENENYCPSTDKARDICAAFGLPLWKVLKEIGY